MCKSSLVIVSYSKLEEYTSELNMSLKIYHGFSIVTLKPKSPFKILKIISSLEKELRISRDVDLLFWEDITEKDCINLSKEISHNFNNKVYCHLISDEFMPIEIKFEFSN